MSRVPFATSYRSHTCAELRAGHVGKEVKLSGAVDRYHEDGSFDLRDSYGKTRVLLGAKPVEMIAQVMNFPDTPPAQRATRLTEESVVTVTGTVRARTEKDGASPTGEVFVDAGGLEILAPSKPNLIFSPTDDKVSPADKRRHRYMSLRNPALHENLRFRTRLAGDLRRFLFARGFLDVQTPMLASRWTPDQTEAFLSVRARAEVFALQGRRSNVGEMLMASGFDRTFEVARRFSRRKEYGPFEQPEYTVLEANLAYVDEPDLIALVLQLIGNIGRTTLGEPVGAVARLTSEEALQKYGAGCPDLRFSLEILEAGRAIEQVNSPRLRDLISQRAVRFIRVPAESAAKAGGDFDKLAAGLGNGGFIDRIAVAPDLTAQVAAGAALDQAAADDAVVAVKAQPGEVLYAVAGKDPVALGAAAGKLRLALGAAVGPGRRNAFALVTRLPYFRPDAGGKLTLQGDPLARPVPGELEGPAHELRALAFSVVLNGVRVGGGSVRNHDLGIQRELFTALGLGAQEVSARYGHVLDAFRFGVPPHARFVLGLDRLAALLLGLASLDDAMAMPKNPDGTDGLARSPSPLSKGIVRGLLGH